MASAFGSALRGVSYLIGLQVFSRVLTFSLNVMIARRLAPEIYGIASVQIPLLLSTILFISRESFRRSALRAPVGASLSREHSNRRQQQQQQQKGDDDDDESRRGHVKELVCVTWLGIFLSALVTAIVTYLFVRFRSDEIRSTIPDYARSMVIVGIAGFVEMLSEPMYVLIQNYLLFQVRVGIEMAAIFLKCLVTFIFVMLNIGLRSFGYAQMTYAVVLCLGYFLYFAKNTNRTTTTQRSQRQQQNRFPIPIRSTADLLFDWKFFSRCLKQKDSITMSTLRITRSFFVQGFEKYILTEGEKIVLFVVVKSLSDQGVFGLVNNLGSIVARLLLQPLEETSFMVFSKLQASIVDKKQQQQRQQRTNEVVETIERMLGALMKLVTIIGLVFVCFGPNYSFLLLDLLFGSKWSHTDAPKVLSAYCLFVFIIAINGITEAFVHAVANERQLSFINKLLVVFSVIYVAVAYLLLHAMQTTGLVFANCINMAMRVAYSLYFIIARYFKNHHKDFDMKKAVPHYAVFAAFGLSFVVTCISYYYYCMSSSSSLSSSRLLPRVIHVAVGAACLVGTLGITYATERKLLQEVVALRKGKAE